MMRVTRPEPVRFWRTEATMAFPWGRLLATADGRLFVLAPDGWTAAGWAAPVGARHLSRREAEDWCARDGRAAHLLDEVPRSYPRP